MINCYVVDNDQFAINTLANYISRIPELSFVGSSTNPLLALDEMKKTLLIDVVFLDVEMPEISGLELAELLPASISKVFTTSFTNYAINAFEVNAIDFLLKPFTFTKFLKTIHKIQAQTRLGSSPRPDVDRNSIFVSPGVRGKVLQIHFETIIYVEGLKNYVIIYTQSGKNITYLKMNEIMDALPDSKFIRVHKSYIVSLNKVQVIEGNMVKLLGSAEVPIGNAFKNNLMKVVSPLIVKSSRQ